MTKLYLVRHGETVANAAQILQGWQGGELNETGKAQAREVAEKMKDTEIDAFVASDFIPDLEHAEWPEDVESLEHMKSRAQNFLTWIKVTYPGQTVLAVGHGIINKAIQSVFFKKPMNEIQKMMNAEVRVLILD